MSDAPRSDDGPRSVLGLFSEMAQTRLELAAIDIQAHVAATLAALAMAVAALVLGLVALTFAGVAVIACFWDTHRVIATLATTGAYFALAFTMLFSARHVWRSRPDPLAATLRELELDREAVRHAV